jgi:hypothetical protein
MKAIKYATASVLTLAVLGTAGSAFAATAGSYVTTGTAGFIASTTTTNPPVVVNPTNPTVPTDPTAPGAVTPTPAPVAPGTGTPGQPGSNTTAVPLTIDYAPTLTFGTGADSVNDSVLYATPQTWSDGSKSANYVQVTDGRGTNAGWFVTLAASPFTGTVSGSSVTLPGATLSFSNEQIVGPSVNLADTTYPATNLATDGTVNNLFGATVGHGSGTSELVFGGAAGVDPTGASSIALNIPNGAAQATTYTSTLTWTMNDTPA